jgi:chromatin remodeling complex protein RSC6
MPVIRLREVKSNSSIKKMTTFVPGKTQTAKAPKAMKVKKEVPAPTPEPVPVVEAPVPVVEAPVPVVVESDENSVDENSVENQISVLRDTISNIEKNIVGQLKVFKTIDQELRKLSLHVKKEFKKKAKKSTKKKPSNNGFNAPVLISKELASFLGVPEGTTMRPPQVSSLINKYANENGLKQETNKAYYNCDDKLKKLLGPLIYPIKASEPSLGNGVSIFNLNSYLKTHYTKVEQTA